MKYCKPDPIHGALIEEYQYDSNGRRTYEMNMLKGITGRVYTYSDEDHLLTAGDITYQYDLDGFLTNKTDGANQTSYVYSSRGELLSINLPDGRIIEYINDPLGRRIVKKVDGVVVEKYLWQGLTRLLAVYDGSDNLVMRFEYADSRMPVAMTAGGVTYYLTYDQVGALRAVVDTSGNVTKRIDYDSFGNIINDTNTGFTIPFGFAGGLHDRDTGLVRFGFRDYYSDIGRWTAKDPILFTGGDTDLYEYVGNDPVKYMDPTGLEVFIFGRHPFIFRYPGNRPFPSQRYIPPRHGYPKPPAPACKPTPQPAPNPMPEPSWFSRFLKNLSDWLDELGLGSGVGWMTPYEQDPNYPYEI